MELSQKLKEARAKAGLKQEELARTLGVSRQTVSNWENGRSYPDIASVLKLSELYGMSLDELLKEDKAVQAHFEDKAAKRRHFWQLALEYAIVTLILGVLVAGRGFRTLGYGIQIAAEAAIWVCLFMHLKFFDHTKEQVCSAIIGFSLQASNLLFKLLFSQYYEDILWVQLVLSILVVIGSLLILHSEVWEQFWKSPRFFLILLLYLGAPLLNLTDAFADTGSFNPVNPFLEEYQVAQVLHGEAPENQEELEISLSMILNDPVLRITGDDDRYPDTGVFSYLAPTATQKEQGIWLMTPEEAPQGQYKVAVEADDSVTLSYSENDRLQFKWLLEPLDILYGSYTISTYGRTIHGSIEPVPATEEIPADPAYLTSPGIVGKGTVALGFPVEDSTMTVYEEYHHGDKTEYREYTLTPDKRGAYTMELETRYDGELEWALYRIPYQEQEFRLTLAFDLGAGDAFRQMLGK